MYSLFEPLFVLEISWGLYNLFGLLKKKKKHDETLTTK